MKTGEFKVRMLSTPHRPDTSFSSSHILCTSLAVTLLHWLYYLWDMLEKYFFITVSYRHPKVLQASDRCTHKRRWFPESCRASGCFTLTAEPPATTGVCDDFSQEEQTAHPQTKSAINHRTRHHYGSRHPHTPSL